MKKRIIPFLVAVLMLLSSVTISAQEKFKDVPEGEWYYNAVYNCVEKKLFSGTTATTFSPNTGMTRAMFVTVLASQHEFDKEDYNTSSFTDVPGGQWYSENVEWAYKNGLVSGIGNGLFAPDTVITRAQLVTLIRTYAEYLGYDMTVGKKTDISSFKDSDSVPMWAVEGFKWAIANKIVSGVKDGNDIFLAPDATATRATVAVIMTKLCEITPRFKYKSVVIIGVDGAGSFNTETPNVDRIFKNGAYTDKMLVTIPSSSAPSWATLMNGVDPDTHGITYESVTDGKSNGNKDHPTVFKNTRDNISDAALCAFCNWHPIYEGIIENNIGVETGTGNDEAIRDSVLGYLDEKQPTLMFVQFDNCDHVGHGDGFNTEPYYEAIQTVDGYIGEIYDKIVEKGYADDTLFIVTADHGGFEDSHGGYTDTEKFVFFGAVGKNIKSNPSLELISQDVPSIVTHALGTKDIANWDSYLPSDLFTDKPNNEARPHGGSGIIPGDETPAKESIGYIGNFLDASKIRTLLTFDGNSNPTIGNIGANEIGKTAYVDGVNGNALRLTPESQLTLPSLTFTDKSFTIASWIRIETLTGDMPFYGNNDWSDEYSQGFAFCSGYSMRFNAGNGSANSDFEYIYPQPYLRTEQWMHTALVVDREQGTVRLYVDFKLLSEGKLSDSLKGASFDGEESNIFRISNDGTGAYGDGTLTAEYDDFLVYDGAMTDSEIANLKSYYLDRK